MARFFIDRPVFAIVISLVPAAGRNAVADRALPIAAVSADRPAHRAGHRRSISARARTSSRIGHRAARTSRSTASTDMRSTSTSVSGDDGTATICRHLRRSERDPDLAAVEVQNRVRSRLQPRCRSEVDRAGRHGRASSRPDILHVPSRCTRPDGHLRPARSSRQLHYVTHRRLAEARQGRAAMYDVFGSEFGMRIWLRPDRMASASRSPHADVVARDPRAERAGRRPDRSAQPPSAHSQNFQYSLRVRGRLVDASRVRRTSSSARSRTAPFVRLRDIGRVELGALATTASPASSAATARP